MTALLQTPFHDWHVSHGGRMVDFAGWDMPVQYSSIITEHQAVRTAVGLFDIAHMGRLKFTGPDAARFLDYLVTNDVTKLAVGRICYALVTNEQGGILDDVLVYRTEDAYLLVVNASNRLKILDWISHHMSGFNATVTDQTISHAMLAIQGPRAEALLQPLVAADLKTLVYYSGCSTKVLDQDAFVSRTGYTGEDGFEIILTAEQSLPLWEKLIAAGAAPCGLGCRDTLRLEAAMPLYGHELSETTDPFTAGVSFGVKLDAGNFIGRDALRELKPRANQLKRVGLELAGKRIAREGAVVKQSGSQVGHVTSGTFSPTLQKSIAMAYLPPALAMPDTKVEIDIRGSLEAARTVSLPFYRRPKSI